MHNIDPWWDRSNDPTPIEPRLDAGGKVIPPAPTNGLAKRLDFAELFAGHEHRLPEVVRCYWPKVIIEGPHDCWLWTGQVAKKTGYGRIRFGLGGKRVVLAAHRFAFAMLHSPGIVPDKVLVRHRCGERLCVNPTHLYLGDYHARPYEATVVKLGNFETQLP
jgi:hypothetical protein